MVPGLESVLELALEPELVAEPELTAKPELTLEPELAAEPDLSLSYPSLCPLLCLPFS